MRGGTLFSGIDAPEVAAPWIDWRWRAEIDAFANAVSAHHRPGIPNLGDVSKIDARAVDPVDLLVFGSPCQSFSVAGRRLGLDDPRGNLALVALALARCLRPRWLVFENVAGLLSSDGGRDFGAFLALLGQCGYGWAWRVLDAQYFGVPQRRRRVFVVGHLGDWRRAAAVLLEPESLRGDSPPRREAGEGIAHSLTARAGNGSRPAGGNGNLAYGGNDTRGPIEIATAVNAHGGPHGRLDFESETFIAHTLTLNAASAGNCTEAGTGRGVPLVPVLADPISASEGKTYSHEGSNNFRLHDVVPVQCNGSNVGTDLPSLRVGNQHISGGGPAVAFAENSCAAIRRLTPRERERLQGFPDDYTLVSYRGKAAADGPRYRALGNSMAVPVMRWILQRVAAADAIAALPVAAE